MMLRSTAPKNAAVTALRGLRSAAHRKSPHRRTLPGIPRLEPVGQFQDVPVALDNLKFLRVLRRSRAKKEKARPAAAPATHCRRSSEIPFAIRHRMKSLVTRSIGYRKSA